MAKDDTNEVRLMKKIEDLHINPSNLKKHNDRSIKDKMEALSTFEQQHPIVIDSNNIVLAGNGRLIAAKKLGWKEIWVTVSSLKESKAIAFSIADNRAAESSDWDYDKLGNNIKTILENAPNITLESMGFEEFEYQPLLNYSSTANIVSSQSNILNNQLLSSVFEQEEKHNKSKSNNSNLSGNSNTPLSVNSFGSPTKKEKTTKQKREELSAIDKGNNSTSILVTEPQNIIIKQAVDLARMIAQDKTLTTGECLQVIAEYYISSVEQLEEAEATDEDLEDF